MRHNAVTTQHSTSHGMQLSAVTLYPKLDISRKTATCSPCHSPQMSMFKLLHNLVA